MQDRVLRRGKVVDEQGRAVGGAYVTVVWGTAPTPEIARRTDAQGAFQVGLPPGRFRLEATTPHARGLVEVEGGEGDDIVVTLTAT
jgi:hypothetical protein